MTKDEKILKDCVAGLAFMLFMIAMTAFTDGMSVASDYCGQQQLVEFEAALIEAREQTITIRKDYEDKARGCAGEKVETEDEAPKSSSEK